MNSCLCDSWHWFEEYAVHRANVRGLCTGIGGGRWRFSSGFIHRKEYNQIRRHWRVTKSVCTILCFWQGNKYLSWIIYPKKKVQSSLMTFWTMSSSIIHKCSIKSQLPGQKCYLSCPILEWLKRENCACIVTVLDCTQ